MGLSGLESLIVLPLLYVFLVYSADPGQRLGSLQWLGLLLLLMPIVTVVTLYRSYPR